MESVSKTLKSIRKTILPKSASRKSRRVRFSNSHSRSRSSSRSRSRSPSPKSSPTKSRRKLKPLRRSLSPEKKLRKAVEKVHGELTSVDDLVDKVGKLKIQSQKSFTRKMKTSPSSPIVLTVKNLDTGKTSNATVVKDLNSGKYELYNLSS